MKLLSRPDTLTQLSEHGLGFPSHNVVFVVAVPPAWLTGSMQPSTLQIFRIRSRLTLANVFRSSGFTGFYGFVSSSH
ncbi:hypothetical protein EG68_12219 [Paragonimus skrjabini miyazakii]|uniref:Uncharacterized protein n=1 Tax=Paragonimus skrjabini miyazakii TaxID=59628 RepID=A0A8S9YD34_9TREM|nr:hypothetical protein EG68_12219 [Paragonimus skrjabini miyazakii]